MRHDQRKRYFIYLISIELGRVVNRYEIYQLKFNLQNYTVKTKVCDYMSMYKGEVPLWATPKESDSEITQSPNLDRACTLLMGDNSIIKYNAPKKTCGNAI